MSNLTVGSRGEDIAAEFLARRGYNIIDRNFRSKRWGEIDIVAIEDNTTVFVEVKTRLSAEYGEPQEAVIPHKLRTLKRAGLYFKMHHQDTPDSLRIDIVGIILDATSGTPLRIELFKDVS